MVESSTTNLQRSANEFVMKAIADNKIIPNSRCIKSMIEKITEYNEDYECLICKTLVYEPHHCKKCEVTILCKICIE